MQLMISVVNVEEARQALQGGAQILDVKNPQEGSLGAQFPGVLRQICGAAPAATRLSAAIGDLPNLPGTAALAALGAAACGVDFVKAGLRGPMDARQAQVLIQAVVEAVQVYPKVQVIAAGYADFLRANTLDPACLPELAAAAGAAGCLIDTAVKDGGRLFDFLSPPQLQAIGREAHARGLLFALAGALQAQDLPSLHEIGADIAGFRTAVCQNGVRESRLVASQVIRLYEMQRELD